MHPDPLAEFLGVVVFVLIPALAAIVWDSYIKYKESKVGTFNLSMRSVLTANINVMEFPGDLEHEILEWLSLGSSQRLHVQNAFPNLTAAQREFLMSGITPEEWKEANK